MKRFAKVPVRLLADPRLSPWAKVVYGILEASSDASGVSVLSQRQIAEKAGTHQPMAARSIAALEKAGYIAVVAVTGNRVKAYRVKR